MAESGAALILEAVWREPRTSMEGHPTGQLCKKPILAMEERNEVGNETKGRE
jgi:hypothetical protein